MNEDFRVLKKQPVLKMQPVQTYKDWFNNLSEKQKADLEENQFEVLVLDEYGNPALAKWLKQPPQRRDKE